MAIGDLVSTNLNTLIEIITLTLIVLGFFRWYDAKYTRTVQQVQKDFNTHFDEVMKNTNDRISRMQMFLYKLDDRLHEHMAQPAQAPKTAEEQQEGWGDDETEADQPQT